MNSDSEGSGGLGGWAQGESRDRELASLALAFLYAAGASLGLFVLLLPRPESVDEVGVALVALAAYPTAAVIMAMRPLSWKWLHVSTVLGIGLITAAVGMSGALGGAYAFYYLWAALFAAYFFSRRGATVHMLLIAVAYAGVIVASGEATDWGFGWMLAIGSLAILSMLVRLLRERIDRLVEQLSRAAETDVLTGLLNRRGFNRCLREELHRAGRSEKPLALVVGDLDRFKEINDGFGHPAGDEALRRVSALLHEAKRESDTMARIGGEEFGLVLPYTDRPGAGAMAERIRRTVRSEFSADGMDLTMSFGIAVYPDDGDTQDLLMRAADAALYAAKELGRDRISPPPDKALPLRHD